MQRRARVNAKRLGSNILSYFVAPIRRDLYISITYVECGAERVSLAREISGKIQSDLTNDTDFSTIFRKECRLTCSPPNNMSPLNSAIRSTDGA